jgi:pimeloyl-ACP methyl ester carboxylesterase
MSQSLVLLPGLLNTPVLWQHQCDTLADLAQITVGDITHAETMNELARGVLARAPERFALAGLSMGGYVALEIIDQAPERVTRLALLDTSARPDTPEKTAYREAQMAVARAGRFDDAVTEAMSHWPHPGRTGEADLMAAMRAMALEVGAEAFARQHTAMAKRPDRRPGLGAIDCPTLILCGRQDEPTPLEGHVEMAAGIPGAALVVIEECGHLTPMERPFAVSAALRYWLQL